MGHLIDMSPLIDTVSPVSPPMSHVHVEKSAGSLWRITRNGLVRWRGESSVKVKGIVLGATSSPSIVETCGNTVMRMCWFLSICVGLFEILSLEGF